jgi:hypothetical protein
MSNYNEGLGQKLLTGGLSAVEHARQAEALISFSRDGARIDWYLPSPDAVALAQVHATLAVARAAIEARTQTVDEPEAPPVVTR